MTWCVHGQCRDQKRPMGLTELEVEQWEAKQASLQSATPLFAERDVPLTAQVSMPRRVLLVMNAKQNKRISSSRVLIRCDFYVLGGVSFGTPQSFSVELFAPGSWKALDRYIVAPVLSCRVWVWLKQRVVIRVVLVGAVTRSVSMSTHSQ